MINVDDVYAEIPNARVASMLPPSPPRWQRLSPPKELSEWCAELTVTPEATYAWVRGSHLPDYFAAIEACHKAGFILSFRYDSPNERPGRVAAHVASAGRPQQLTACLTALLNGTSLPSRLVIFLDGSADSPENLDHVLRLAAERGISWSLHIAGGHGQVACHIRACELLRDHPLALRLDDDIVPTPDCLAELMQHMADDVFAVAPMVPQSMVGRPPFDPIGLEIEGAAYGHTNAQWSDLPANHPPLEAEHLHCCFLYRPVEALRHYPRILSRVGHREETWLTYKARCAGRRLLIVPSAVVLHLRASKGGIRDGRKDMFERDEFLFRRMLALQDEKERVGGCWVPFTFGVGDCMAFDSIVAPTLPGPVRVPRREWPTDNCQQVAHEDCLIMADPQNPQEHNPYRLLSTAGPKDGNFWANWAARYRQ